MSQIAFGRCCCRAWICSETHLEQRVQALFVMPDLVLNRHRARLADLAARYLLPAMHAAREDLDASGLMACIAHARSTPGRARFVDKILKVARAADLPVDQPTKFELFINPQTAKGPLAQPGRGDRGADSLPRKAS